MSAKKLMAGKRGLIMGVANQHSIAWGIAKAAHDHGAELAFTFQGEAFEKRVRPIAESVNAAACLPCNVATDESIKETFEALGKVWDSFDFVVHAIAYSDKEELKGRYVDTTRNNFRHTLDISCFSFTSVAKYAEPMLRPGGKAALEASVKYLAVDLGRNGVRVNALSAGPMRTLAGSAIAGARFTYNWQGKSSPLRRNIELEEVGNSGLYLISDLSGGVTGEVHYVDSGYHLVGMAIPAETDLE